MNAASSAADALVAPLTAIEKLIARRELQPAAEQLNALARRAPGDPRVYLLGSRLGHAAGNPEASVESARRAARIAPHWAPAAAELALALARANEFDDALTAATQAVQLDGDNPALLAAMINVARLAQNTELSMAWLEKALRLSPDNLALKRMMARDLRSQKRHAEALAIYNQILAAKPDDAESRLGRLQTALDMGDTAAARADAEALLAAEPANSTYQFWATLARGETPQFQPAAMVARLYDGIAAQYDRHVLRTLKYELPVAAANRILGWHPDRKLNLLDLGCGTGLLGASLRRIDGAMIGVDISRAMIEQAVRRNVYDNIHFVDVRDALEGTSADQYEVIAALDVFTYVGATERAFQNALRILKPGGRLVASFESATGDEPDLVLRPSMRFAHRQAAVEAACLAAGFARVEIEPLVLREEDQQPVQGFVVVARKSA